MRIIRKLSIGLPAVLLAAAALCQSLPVANRPEDLGMSSQRLERIRLQMNADIEGGRIPGAVLLIARNGRIAPLDALGFQERKSQTPMRTDSIFRIASMSKPITSVKLAEDRVQQTLRFHQEPEFRTVGRKAARILGRVRGKRG